MARLGAARKPCALRCTAVTAGMLYSLRRLFHSTLTGKTDVHTPQSRIGNQSCPARKTLTHNSLLILFCFLDIVYIHAMYWSARYHNLTYSGHLCVPLIGPDEH